MISKKDQSDTFGYAIPKERFYTCIFRYHSFFMILVRRVWIDEKKRPVVRITGSHKHSCLFGAISLAGKQLFTDSTIYSMEIPSLTF